MVSDITNELEDLFFLDSPSSLLNLKHASGCPSFNGTLPAHVIHYICDVPFFTLGLSHGLPGNDLADSVHRDLHNLGMACFLR